jgi:S-DNA-T family DNA segregation ATPase FtsK/SpoIIIE
VLLAVLALVTLMAMLGLTRGELVDPWVELLRRWLGWGSILVPLVFAGGVLVLLRHRLGHPIAVAWTQVIAFEIAIVGALGLLTILDGMDLPRAEAGAGGGLIGWAIATLLGDGLGSVGRVLALAGATLVAGGYGLRGALTGLARRRRRPGPAVTAESLFAQAGETPVAVLARPEPSSVRRRKVVRRLPPEYRKNFRVPEKPQERPSRPAERHERLPPFDILDRSDPAWVSSKEVNFKAGLIEKTLADFGLPARVVDFRTGPCVTQFAVEPGFIEQVGPDGRIRRHKVRVSQISALANDLALALSAPTLRIEAPVPGRAYVGIEVPNLRAAPVRLGPILESRAFQSVGSPLAVALGRDVSGAPVAADLAAMPHLLIAGTTGSGKSVCITALSTCLAINNSPEDLRLVMIDPKMVELVRFNGLPHLYGKVEAEPDRIVGVLRWCTQEMERRYKLLEAAGVRDIEIYNRRARRRRRAERLPCMVVIIDELADIMAMAPDQTERTLVRLAQMARATGIHLVVATQRPSTDILTGLIKANFPARISFAVASSVDSRVILDTVGAETLLGRGDMLMLSPNAAGPVRLQGVFVSDMEIERLVDHWRSQTQAGSRAAAQAPPWEALLARQAALEDRDEILEEAIELVKRTGQASASMLQRRLRVGYPRAARLMDELEELGVVGRAQAGGRSREVLIRDDEDPLAPEDQG